MKETKLERLTSIIHQLIFHGFTYEEAYCLLRQNQRLLTWGEKTCNGEIERDEETGKTYCVGTFSGARGSRCIDHETGALRICNAIVEARNKRVLTLDDRQPVEFYHQSDPRGVQVYIVRKSDVPPGGNIDSYYSRGIAVYRP